MKIISHSILGAAAAALLTTSASAQLTITNTVTSGDTAADLVSVLVTSPAITVVGGSEVLTGDLTAAGTFTGGDTAGADPAATGDPILGAGFSSGIVLGSGNVEDGVGPNSSDDTTTILGTSGDTDLETIVGAGTTADAATLSFDFTVAGAVGTTGFIAFDFVFASEEYNEWTNTQFNDVFGFFLNGVNIAETLTGDPIAVNSVNGGNPLGVSSSNPAFFRNNDLSDGGPFIDIEYDGLTTVITVGGAVAVGGGTNSIKLAISDTGDSLLDSAVFLAGGSFIPSDDDIPKIPEPSTVGILTIVGLFAMAQVRRRLLRK